MFDAIAPRYDLVNRLMTFGLDIRWRRSRPGRSACRRARGSSTWPAGLETFWPSSGAAGLGPSAWTSRGACWRPTTRATPLAQADGSALPLATGSVDGITCGYALRNFTDLRAVFTEFGRVVRPGGRISLLEVAEPEGGPAAAGAQDLVPTGRARCIGGLLSDRAAYRYLPRSTAYLPPTDELRSMLMAAGFSAVNHRLLSGGLSQLLTATRAGVP